MPPNSKKTNKKHKIWTYFNPKFKKTLKIFNRIKYFFFFLKINKNSNVQLFNFYIEIKICSYIKNLFSTRKDDNIQTWTALVPINLVQKHKTWLFFFMNAQFEVWWPRKAKNRSSHANIKCLICMEYCKQISKQRV